MEEKTYEDGIKRGIEMFFVELQNSDTREEIERLFNDLPIDYTDRTEGWNSFLEEKMNSLLPVKESVNKE